MSEYPAVLRRVLLLVVLFAPLGTALAVAVTRGIARRVAVWLALVHVVVVAALAAMTVGDLTHRGEKLDDSPPALRFNPIGVPGDVAALSDLLDEGATGWTLLPLGPTQPNIPPPAVQFFVGLDGFNLWLLALGSVMTLVAVLASWNAAADRPGLLAWLFVLQFAATGAFVAFDLVLFYVFFELTLVPAFFLIGRYGVGGGRRQAAHTFVLYTLFGSLLTLAGAAGLVLTNPTPLSQTSAEPRMFYGVLQGPGGELTPPAVGPLSFSIPRLMQNAWFWAELRHVEVRLTGRRVAAAEEAAAAAAAQAAAAPADRGLAEAAARARVEADRRAAERDDKVKAKDRRQAVQVWLFVLLVAGFAVKTPIVPFHSWLPAAYAEAPLGATLLFSAVLAKLGTFGLLRIVLPLCPDAMALYGLPVLGTLGGVGIVYAAFCAYAQRDLKLLAAYSSVSHLGFLVLGLVALNREGVTGAALHMVNHGLTAGGLFAVLAVLYDRYRTLDQHAYGGVAARLPGYAVLTMVLCLAGIGLPGLCSFVSEMLLMASLFDPATARPGRFALACAAAAGLFLSAWYVITLLRRVFFGPERLPPSDAPPAKLTRAEGFALGIPAVLCLVIGVWPQPILDTLKADAVLMGRHLGQARERVGLTAPETPRP